MPISKLQSKILKLIALKRDPESFIAGSVPVNRAGPSYSADIGIFHDRQDRVAEAVLADTKALTEAGFDIVWLRQRPATYSASTSSVTAPTTTRRLARAASGSSAADVISGDFRGSSASHGRVERNSRLGMLPGDVRGLYRRGLRHLRQHQIDGITRRSSWRRSHASCRTICRARR